MIILTASGTIESAVEAMRKGVFGYLTKPVNNDELLLNLKDASAQTRSFVIGTDSRSRFEENIPEIPEMIGNSEIMRMVRIILARISPTDSPVLLTGPAGTGKESVAKAIHSSSPRRDHPFVTINCGAVPEDFLESELFGHEKGSFTDAIAQKRGKFELADGGTIFLDEIGELSRKLQVKLLRALEDHKIERVGGREEISLDVRIIAATNRELINEVKEGAFRADLYYRLSIISIPIPPLCERGDDILLLATTFLNRYARENAKSGLGFSEAALRSIAAYDWPGNVRELENKIKRAVIMAQDKRIRPRDLVLPEAPAGSSKSRSLQEVREEAEKKCLANSLTLNNWNVSQVGRELGVSRTTLYDLIRKYQLNK